MKIIVTATYEKTIELEVEDNLEAIKKAVSEVDWEEIPLSWVWTIATDEGGDEVYAH